MKVVSFLTRRRNFLKLIMYNSGAIVRSYITGWPVFWPTLYMTF